MSKIELGEALKEVQSKLPDGCFVVIEKECVEFYSTDEFLPTPLPANLSVAR